MRKLPFIALCLAACGTSQPKDATPEPVPPGEPLTHEPAPAAEVLKASDVYPECASVRVQGEAAARGEPLPAATDDGALVVWPAADCAGVEGWAGVDYAYWGLAKGFSADGTKYVHCGNGDNDCEILASADGKVVKALKTKGTYDTAPEGILTDRVIAAQTKKLKLTDVAGRWPDGGVIVSWTIAFGDGENNGPETLVYLVHERTTGAEVELARFTLPKPDPGLDNSVGWVSPQPVQLAPDGKTLALLALHQQDQSLRTEVKVVPVARALAEVYTAAAAKDPANAAAWNAKRDALK